MPLISVTHCCHRLSPCYSLSLCLHVGRVISSPFFDNFSEHRSALVYQTVLPPHSVHPLVHKALFLFLPFFTCLLSRLFQLIRLPTMTSPDSWSQRLRGWYSIYPHSVCCIAHTHIHTHSRLLTCPLRALPGPRYTRANLYGSFGSPRYGGPSYPPSPENLQHHHISTSTSTPQLVREATNTPGQEAELHGPPWSLSVVPITRLASGTMATIFLRQKKTAPRLH